MLSIDMDSFWKYKDAKNFPYWDFFWYGSQKGEDKRQF